MTKVFTIDELKSVINMKDVVESVDRTFKGLAEGVVINPTKVTLDLAIRMWPASNGSAVFWVKEKKQVFHLSAE